MANPASVTGAVHPVFPCRREWQGSDGNWNRWNGNNAHVAPWRWLSECNKFLVIYQWKLLELPSASVISFISQAVIDGRLLPGWILSPSPLNLCHKSEPLLFIIHSSFIPIVREVAARRLPLSTRLSRLSHLSHLCFISLLSSGVLHRFRSGLLQVYLKST